MRIHSSSVLPFPRSLVYETYRDRLSAIAEEMTDIRKIDVLSRKKEDDQTVRIHNRWYAQVTLPAMAERVVKQEWRQWDDHAVWRDDAFFVDWRLEIPTFGDQVQCSGRNSFVEVEGGTEAPSMAAFGSASRRSRCAPDRRVLPEVEVHRSISPPLRGQREPSDGA